MSDEGPLKLSDEEVFELRNPGERDKHYTIEVTLNGSTNEYTARFGTFYGVHKTLAEALSQLANRLDAARVYGSEHFAVEEKTGKRLRCCEYCGSPIYFAKTPKGNWMPVEGTSVDAKHLEGMRSFNVVDAAGQPSVQWLSRPKGQVWIPHPEVCGTNETGPASVKLRERWEVNRKRVEERQETVVSDLRSLVTDLEEL